MKVGRRPRGSLMGEGAADGLRREGRTPTLLAFHGFTGTPQEVALVVDAAAELGLGAEAPLLPGHGLRVADLAATRFSDWLAAAEDHYARLAERGPVLVAGLSMGALLALSLAKNHPGSTAGVVALSNAMWLGSPWPTLPLELVGRLRVPDFWVRKSGPDLGDVEQRAVHLTYDAQPVRAAVSLLKAGQVLAEQLAGVHAPTLLLHGALDAVAPVQNAYRVAVRLGTTDKRVVVFPRSRHILTRDVERDRVKAELLVFFARFASTSASGEPAAT